MQNIYLGRDFKVSRIVNYSVRAFVRISTFPFNHIKDSKLKELVRRLVLRLQNSLPIELVTHKSQVAVIPRPRNKLHFLSEVETRDERNVLQGAGKIPKASKKARVYARRPFMDYCRVLLNQAIGRYLEVLSFKTMITAGEPSSTVDKSWLKREGDVSAWKR